MSQSETASYSTELNNAFEAFDNTDPRLFTRTSDVRKTDEELLESQVENQDGYTPGPYGIENVTDEDIKDVRDELQNASDENTADESTENDTDKNVALGKMAASEEHTSLEDLADQ